MSERYVVFRARGEGGNLPTLEAVISDCPAGYALHSITPATTGSGYTAEFIVVFEKHHKK